MLAQPFTDGDTERWDELVERAPMATFLHTRRFLSYHGERLEDASLLFTDDRGALRALLPAAVDPHDRLRVTSHPGATFGGLLHDGAIGVEQVEAALAAASEHYAGAGHATLTYKAVPHIYHRSPSADDVWALHALGATRTRCGLSCTIDLAARRQPSSRRQRSLRKAERAGVEAAPDGALADFWPVLEARLEERYAARPVHALDEIELLRTRFPGAIALVTGRVAGEVVAGVVLFRTPRVAHVQYMAAGESGMRIGALDAVLERCIASAREEGARFFDFGTSMRDGGRGLETGLYGFKAEFGGGGVIHETYELALGGDRA